MNLFNRYNGKRLLVLLLLVVTAWLIINRSTGIKNKTVIVDCTPAPVTTVLPKDTLQNNTPVTAMKETLQQNVSQETLDIMGTDPAAVIAFAKTLIGIPYVYASSNPLVGFDCSGFITYVFNHFNIQVPRSSVDFSKLGRTVAVDKAKTGDIILFTGTNELERNVGHMGLVVSNDNSGLQFIHATSGKAMSVTVSPFNEQYKKRFVRVSRVFDRNG